MSEEKRRFLPYLGNKLVKIVGSGCAVCLNGLNTMTVRNILQKTVIIVVDKLTLLTFAKALNCEVKLGFCNVVRRTVNVLNSGIDVDNSRNVSQTVLTGLFLILYVALGNDVALLGDGAEYVKGSVALDYLVYTVNAAVKSLKLQDLGYPLRNFVP